MGNHRSRSILVIQFIQLTRLTALILILPLSSCRTPPRPAPPEASAPLRPAAPAEKPNPFLTEWAGTTWIIRDPEHGPRSGGKEAAPRTFPGYRGFHLARDGRLLLINMDEALGDRWRAHGNELQLSFISGPPHLPLEGPLLAFIPENGDSDSMRLVPSSDSASPGQSPSPGIVFERAGAAVDIVENHWIPKKLTGGDSVMWPMNREIHLIILPDGSGGLGILGYGGENRFRGTVIISNETFQPGPISKTAAFGPNSEFENLFTARIGESTRSIQVDHDLFLFSRTRPAAAFRVQLFD